MARETNPTQLLRIDKALRTHPTVKWLFRSTLKDSLHNNFGAVAVAADFTDVTGLIFQANSPKPARASKRTTDPEIEGAYCAYDKTAELRSDKYSIKQPVNRLRMGTTLTDVLYVSINGLKIAWRSPKPNAEQTAEIGSYKTLLGIEVATATDRDLVFGATFPRLPRVMKTLADGSKFSSYCDSTKVDDALEAGWSLADAGMYPAQDLNNLLR
jgi:hypothetical protein